jgi:lysophospholipase L1-like esterase
MFVCAAVNKPSFPALLLIAGLAVFSGCNGGDDAPPAYAGAGAGAEMVDMIADEENKDNAVSGDIGNNDPNLLVAIGDSLTGGGFGISPYPNRLAGILGKKVQNFGSGGATSGAAPGQAQRAIGRNPAYLLIMFGTNDAFQELPADVVANNIASAVQIAKANKTIPVVATLPPILRSEFLNQQIDSYNARISSVARSQGALIARVNREFGSGEGLILEDGFHPNETGTQIIALAFADAIR